MDQDNIEISNNQNLGQEVPETVEVESKQVESNSEVNTEAASKEQEQEQAPSEGSQETYTKEQFEKSLQERLARERRKLQRELRMNNPNMGYQQPVAPSFSQNAQQQVAAPQQLTQQQLASLSPEQQADYYLQDIVSKKVNEERQREAVQAEQMKARNFLSQIQQQAAKDEDFDDFINYEVHNIARQLMPHQTNGLASLFDLSQQLNDPKILFEVHKQNPEEFRNLINMPRELQAVKLGEHRARAAMSTRKVVSNAPAPISEPAPKASSQQKIVDPLNPVVTDRVALLRAQRRSH